MSSTVNRDTYPDTLVNDTTRGQYILRAYI